jgi:hypothetical protein
MSDFQYNNNPNDKCIYCSHTYIFHSSSSNDDDNNIQEGIKSKKKNPHDDDNPKGCRFVNNVDGSSCICPGFRSASSIPIEY